MSGKYDRDYYVPNGARCPATGKRMWNSRADAKRIAKREQPHERMRAYVCEDCNRWHLGHLRRSA